MFCSHAVCGSHSQEKRMHPATNKEERICTNCLKDYFAEAELGEEVHSRRSRSLAQSSEFYDEDQGILAGSAGVYVEELRPKDLANSSDIDQVKKRIEAEKAQLTEKVVELEGVITSYKKQNEDNLAIISRLERRLDRSPTRDSVSLEQIRKVADLEALVDELRSELAAKASRKASSSSSSSSSDDDSKGKGKAKKLKEKLDRSETALKDLKRQHHAESDAWEIEKAQMLSRFMAAEEQIVAVEKLKTAVTELKEERSKLESANVALQGEVAALSLSANSSREEMTGFKAENSSLQSRLSDLEHNLSDLRNQTSGPSDSSDAQVIAALASEDRLKRRVKALEDEKSSLEFVISTQQTKINEAGLKFLEVEQQLREEKQRSQSLSTDFNELSEKLTEATAKLEVKGLEISTLNATITKCQQDLSSKRLELQAELDRQQQMDSKANETQKALAANIAGLERKLEASKTSEATLVTQLADQTATNKKLAMAGESEKLVAKQEEIGRLNIELDNSKDREARANQSIKNLEGQMVATEEKLKKLNEEWGHREADQKNVVEDLRNQIAHQQSLLESTKRERKKSHHSSHSDSSSTDSDVEDLRTQLEAEKRKVEDFKQQIQALKSATRRPSATMSKSSSSTLGEWDAKKGTQDGSQPKCSGCSIF